MAVHKNQYSAPEQLYSMKTATAQKKINILFIIDVLFGYGGTETHLNYLIRHIDRKRFNCYIVSFFINEWYVKKLRDKGIEVYHIPVKNIHSLCAIYQGLRIRRLIKEKHIDIVQTFHFMSDTYGALVSRLSGVQHIISSRRDTGFNKSKYKRLLNRVTNRLIENFITVCDAVGETLTETEGVPGSKQQTIYNGIDTKEFNRPSQEEIKSTRKKLAIGDNDFIVGILGHMRPEKNHNIFFKAILEARRSIPDIKAIVIGGGKLEDHYRKYCAENGLDGCVRFTGMVSCVDKYLSLFDIGCLISKTEGMSNALLEMMAFGKPLIVTAVGGNIEVVKDGINGILIPPDDSAELARVILELYANPDLRDEMGNNNISRVESFFTNDRMIKTHEELYTKIIGA